MALQPGAQAPDVTLVSHDNEKVLLSDFHGRQPVVLLFFPLAFTSTCTAELCAVRDDIDSYEDLNAEVFAVSVDSPYVLNQYREQTEAPYVFLSDFNRQAGNAFDVVRTDPIGPGLLNTTERAVFVIGLDGKIAYSWCSSNYGLIPPFDEVKDTLRRL